MPFKLRKTVVMVGMMGAGKTAIGQALAKRLHVPFLDSDAEIAKAANRTIAEIFERDGEPFFRDRESEVIARLLDGAPCILSTGGGAFLREENRRMISEKGASLWLRAELELLWQRVKHKTTRPLLHTPDPRATLAQIQKNRDPLYALADIVVDAEFDFSIDQMTDRVIDTLSRHPEILEAH
ncbi:MAG: shikimate kinase [Silicimonas sp.]|nr:shikimate kinase [Silicimonas sp.]